MARIKIRHLVEKPGRGGRPNYYWQPAAALRAHGFRPRRLADERSLAIAEAERLNAELDRWRERRAAGFAEDGPDRKVAAGSVADFIRRFKASEEWAGLGARTQRNYEYALVEIEAWAGDAPIAAITRRRVKTLYKTIAWQRDEDGKRVPRHPAKASLLVRVLSALFAYAMDEDEALTHNPASKQKLTDTAKKGLLWSPAAIAAFVASADALGLPSIGGAVAIDEWLGQRECDLIALPRASYRDRAISLEQSKTEAGVMLPIGMVPHLVERLEAELARGRARNVAATTILVCEATGLAWAERGFRAAVAAVREHAAAAAMERQDHGFAAELRALQFRYLRHTAVTRLAEAGCELAEIAAITGHSLKTVHSIIDRYLVRTAKLARNAFRRRMAADAADLDEA